MLVYPGRGGSSAATSFGADVHVFYSVVQVNGTDKMKLWLFYLLPITLGAVHVNT